MDPSNYRRWSYEELKNTLFFTIILLTFLFPSIATALDRPLRVHEVCECVFPAEVGAFGHINAILVRFTLLRSATVEPVMVREIFAERHGKQYRIISMVDSTETKTVGKVGPIVEVMKWNGPYWPGKILYQLTPEQIQIASEKLAQE